MSAWQDVFSGLTSGHLYLALSILVVFLLAGWLFYFLLRRLARKLVLKSGTTLDNLVLESLEKPIFIALALLGAYLALVVLPFVGPIEAVISRITIAAFVALGVYTAVAAIEALLKWYALEVASKTKTTLDDSLVAALRLGVPIIATFLGVVLLLDIFGFPVESVQGWLRVHGGRIGLMLGVSVLLLLGSGAVVPKLVERTVVLRKPEEPEEEVKKRAETLSRVLVTTGQVLIIATASFTLLSEVGVNIAPVLAGAGVVGLAIGFGAQSLIKDIISGIFIISDNQYRVGDVAKIAGTAGLVEEINLRRTVLRDLDGVVHFIPNGEITVASNLTRGLSRVNLNISVAYGEDLDRVIAVINRVGNELAEDPAWAPLILKSPQVLRVDNLGDSGIDIKIVGDTKPIQQWAVMGELRLRLKRTFDREGIEIPWPHTKVYFGNPVTLASPEVTLEKGPDGPGRA
ncbi:MAG: mechanosensitive ion channel family protein [Chloroflexi bacterium]|nr:mechanosensitive ion channel family protein [Chloroflexota bacterium]